MARKRMIDPGFWSDEKIIELSFMERLLFIGYWNFADDNGVHVYSLKSLKAEIFPADDLPLSTINNLLNGLIEKHLLLSYHNEEYLFCPMWAKHQTINKPQTSSNPLPPIGSYDQQKKLYAEGKIRGVILRFLNKAEPLPEHYGNNTVTLLPNRIEENRSEEKGREEVNARAREETPPPSQPPIILIRVFEKEFGRPLSPIEIDRIRKWEEDTAPEVVVEALKRAVLLGKFNFKYIDSILLEWEKNNIRTVREVLEHEARFREKVDRSKGCSPNSKPDIALVNRQVQDDAKKLGEAIESAAFGINFELEPLFAANSNPAPEEILKIINHPKFNYDDPRIKEGALKKLGLEKYVDKGA